MHNHANQIVCMPGVLLIDGDKPGFFTEHELMYELKSLCFNPKKASESKSRREVRHKIVTIRTVDRILNQLTGQGE